MSNQSADAAKLEKLKRELAIVEAQEVDLKKLLDNTIMNVEILKKYPDMPFTYPGILFGREKTIAAKTVAAKINEMVIPQLAKMVAIKIAERSRLEKLIKESK